MILLSQSQNFTYFIMVKDNDILKLSNKESKKAVLGVAFPIHCMYFSYASTCKKEWESWILL